MEYCRSLGLDTMGVIPCRPFEELREFYVGRQEKKLQNEFEEKDLERRIHPNLLMEEGKSIISIAFPYYHQEKGSSNGFSTYTKRTDYHKVVRSYLNKICEWIESHGGKAKAFVDSNSLPERYIAYLAGVGFIGRNNMIITKNYGSYVFLGEIITDLEITSKDQRRFEEIVSYKECGSCRNCYKECPTKSIHGGRINPNICVSYLTQKKELSDQEIKLMKGKVFGCDSCQLECPYNVGVRQNVLPEFETLGCMEEELEVYAGMDNKFFKEKISGTSCGWRGKNVLRRNAIIELKNQGKEICSYLGDSDYINSYIKRLEG